MPLYSHTITTQENILCYTVPEKGIASLEGPWRIKRGDSPLWASPDFDDSSWQTFNVPGNLMDVYPGHTGTAWYRASLCFPSDTGSTGYSLVLGKICDVDEVYLNGRKIGSTGSIDDNDSHAFDRLRIYHIPGGLIKNNGHNVISVRVRGYLPDSAGMIWGYYRAGESTSIDRMVSRSLVIESLFIAFYMLIAGLFLIFSQKTNPLRQQQKCFAFFSLCISLYLVCVGQVKYLFIDSFILFHVLQYIFGISAAIIFILLLKLLFRRPISMPDIAVMGLLVLAALAVPVIREISWFTVPRLIWQSSVLYILFLMVRLSVQTIRAGRRDYMPVILGMGIVLPGAILELLRAYTIVPDFDYFKTSLPGLIILVSYFLSNQLSITRHMKAQLIENLEHKVAERTRLLQERNEAMESELEIARSIQSRLLPHRFPMIKGLHIDSICIPMDRIGGDFYTYCEDERHIRFLIADVAGHGVASAFLALIVKNAFDSVDNLGYSEDELLGMINEIIFRYAVPSHFVTAFVITIDKKSRRCTYSNAGHHPALLLRKETNACMELYVRGTSLGWRTDVNFSRSFFQLLPGDRLVLYTDGIVECMDEKRDLYGKERLETFIKNGTEASPSQTVLSLIDELRAFNGGGSFEDDISCVVVDVL